MKVFKHPQFASPGGICIKVRELFLPRIARISRIPEVFYPRTPRNPWIIFKTSFLLGPFPAGVFLTNLPILCLSLCLVFPFCAKSEESTKEKSQHTIRAGWPVRDSVPVKVMDEDGKPVQGAQVTPDKLGNEVFILE